MITEGTPEIMRMALARHVIKHSALKMKGRLITMDKTYDNVKIEREGGTTFLVLNRPEKRNAMSPALHYDVEDALTWLEDDAETKVLVLAGAG